MNRLQILLWIVGAGAFGGFVDGLLVPRHYRLRLGNATLELGSLGDALVGATAGVAIFSVADALFNIQIDQMDQPAHFVKLVAWGVLSGYAGLRLLQPLTTAVITDVAGRSAREALREEAVVYREASIHTQSGEAVLADFDRERFGAGQGGKTPEDMDRLLNLAENKFKAALAVETGSPDALRGVGKVFKRRAWLAEQAGDHDGFLRLMNEAVDTVSAIISANPQYAFAHYSRACYKALLNKPRADVLADLREAIRLNPAIRQLAPTDPDFEALRENVEFIELTAVGSAADTPAAGEGWRLRTPPSTGRRAKKRRRWVVGGGGD
jgi:ribosomal protein S18 acetylase RimI-like enzyme